ncbi:helix-turn-helix domain-containing protein [Pseudonocardia sp. RS010]|uniref:helix-turn-helix domain-containing protein n=1 Tax=Pseudonocardia sp. RS010 TaxID=3385979 RepID=UPI0039A0CD51
MPISIADPQKVRAAIIASGLTHREIARRVGVSDSSVSHWFTGWRRPSPRNMVRLAQAIGVDRWSLVWDEIPR